ncbi:MAG: polyprenol monophosphomannose synthase [Planctomycetota bacterium]
MNPCTVEKFDGSLMRTAPRTLITIATYNEIENLPPLVEELFTISAEFHILVIDDNSPDGTGTWCDAAADRDPRIHCLHRPAKLGLGTAIVAGMNYAIDNEYDYALNLDADFSHDPVHVPALLAAIENEDGESLADLTIGSRYVSGGSTPGWPLQRRIVSQALNYYTRFLLGLKTRDCSGGFRCYRTSILKTLELARIRSRGYSFQEEILWHLKRVGARSCEVPIAFRDRRRGNSKISVREAIGAVWFVTRLAFSVRMRLLLGVLASRR